MAHATTSDLDHYYAPLPEHSSAPARSRRRSLKGFAAIFVAVLFVFSLVGVILKNQGPVSSDVNNDDISIGVDPEPMPASPRGVSEGVSAKSNPAFSDEYGQFNWTNAMFAWQRTSFHFQPEKNWMNDPDGPLFYMGWYHLFYQYNPDSAIWGNITWGHAVSRDLIHWLYLPLAMVPDQWYDINGVWTGSATLLPDGNIAMLYTGDTNASVQVQNLAYPANLSDPLLLDWVKYPGNPVMLPPPGIAADEFRDPSTAWLAPDGTWRLTIGSTVNGTGISLNYKTTNFTTFELLDNILHAVPGTGEWECVDFYPVSTNGSNGLDTSVYGPGTKHVLKASLDNTKRDVYALGTYYPENNTWTPDNPELDVGIGLEVDYGRYYASKTFYDQNKERRILWGWINETDTEGDDLDKGWASVQTIPRVVTFDDKTGANILEWPVEEVESLRLNSTEFTEVEVAPGSVVALDIGSANQLDILAEFEYQVIESNETQVTSVGCGYGAVDRSTFGPFGILVLADESLSELTPVYFNIANSTDVDDTIVPHFCADETRSSIAQDVQKFVYGSSVPVLDGEKMSMRLLVDHSIIESFGQGGRRVITSRVYPTEAIYGAAKVFLFNNATGVTVKASLKIWEMNSAFIHPFPLDQM